MERKKSPDMWLGLKRCGCPVAACVDEAPAKLVEQSKRDFLKQGLQVIVVSWAEWQEKWRPIFVRDCPHDVKKERPAQSELSL